MLVVNPRHSTSLQPTAAERLWGEQKATSPTNSAEQSIHLKTRAALSGKIKDTELGSSNSRPQFSPLLSIIISFSSLLVDVWNYFSCWKNHAAGRCFIPVHLCCVALSISGLSCCDNEENCLQIKASRSIPHLRPPEGSRGLPLHPTFLQSSTAKLQPWAPCASFSRTTWWRCGEKGGCVQCTW